MWELSIDSDAKYFIIQLQKAWLNNQTIAMRWILIFFLMFFLNSYLKAQFFTCSIKKNEIQNFNLIDNDSSLNYSSIENTIISFTDIALKANRTKLFLITADKR